MLVINTTKLEKQSHTAHGGMSSISSVRSARIRVTKTETRTFDMKDDLMVTEVIVTVEGIIRIRGARKYKKRLYESIVYSEPFGRKSYS